MAGGHRHCDDSLLFCFGADGCGGRDALLISESGYDRMARIRLEAQGRVLTLRLAAAREHGRGWVLASFEVMQAGEGLRSLPRRAAHRG